MIESNDTSETLYFYIQEIKTNNEAQEKALEKQKFVINTESNLYDKLLNRYTTQYDNISKGLKKRLSVLNRPEMLILDFDEDDLLQKGNEEVKLELEETISENEILKKKENNRDSIKNLDSKQIVN